MLGSSRYMLHTAVCFALRCVRACMYADTSGNAAVNPPLRHGREVTRVNERKASFEHPLLFFSLSSPGFFTAVRSFIPPRNATRISQEMVAKAGFRRSIACVSPMDSSDGGGSLE